MIQSGDPVCPTLHSGGTFLNAINQSNILRSILPRELDTATSSKRFHKFRRQEEILNIRSSLTDPTALVVNKTQDQANFKIAGLHNLSLIKN